jgi:hypothetical protein
VIKAAMARIVDMETLLLESRGENNP